MDGGGGSYSQKASKKKNSVLHFPTAHHYKGRGALRTGQIPGGARTQDRGVDPGKGKWTTWQPKGLGPGAPPNMCHSWKKDSHPLLVIYKVTRGVMKAHSRVRSALPGSGNPVCQRMNTELTPQRLYFMAFNSWIYLCNATIGFGRFLFWLQVNIFLTQ